MNPPDYLYQGKYRKIDTSSAFLVRFIQKFTELNMIMRKVALRRTIKIMRACSDHFS